MPRGVKKVVEEVVEEVKVEEAPAEQPVADEVPVEEAPAEVVEEAPAEEITTDAVVDAEPVAEEAVEAEPVIEEAPVEDKKEETTAEVKEEKKDAVKEGEWKFYANLRIYPSFGDRTRVKVISGNVKVTGKKGDLTQIQYLKHGFGLVDAFTDQI